MSFPSAGIKPIDRKSSEQLKAQRKDAVMEWRRWKASTDQSVPKNY